MGLFLQMLDKETWRTIDFDQWTLVGKFKNGLNDLLLILPRSTSVALPRLYGLRRTDNLLPPPPNGYLHLQRLQLNADLLSAIPHQYLQKLTGLVRLDFEVFTTAKWKDILKFFSHLPLATKLKEVNFID